MSYLILHPSPLYAPAFASTVAKATGILALLPVTKVVAIPVPSLPCLKEVEFLLPHLEQALVQ